MHGPLVYDTQRESFHCAIPDARSTTVSSTQALALACLTAIVTDCGIEDDVAVVAGEAEEAAPRGTSDEVGLEGRGGSAPHWDGTEPGTYRLGARYARVVE